MSFVAAPSAQETNTPQPHSKPSSPQAINVGQAERIVSLATGGALLFYAIRNPSPRGLLATVFGAGLLYRGQTGHCSFYSAFGANTNTERLTRIPFLPAVKVQKSVTVNAPAATLYEFWHNFQNLPTFMRHLKSVTVQHDGRSHWVVAGPNGQDYEWDAAITNETPHQSIAWQSVENADVVNVGKVEFTEQPHNRGTIVKVTLEYRPPLGLAGLLFAKFQGTDPAAQIHDDLRRFKQLIEAGEIATSLNQSRGENLKLHTTDSRIDHWTQDKR